MSEKQDKIDARGAVYGCLLIIMFILLSPIIVVLGYILFKILTVLFLIGMLASLSFFNSLL